MGWSIDVLVWSADAGPIKRLLDSVEPYSFFDWRLSEWMLHGNVRKLDQDDFLKLLAEQSNRDGWPLDATVVLMGDDLGYSLPHTYLIRNRKVQHLPLSKDPGHQSS